MPRPGQAKPGQAEPGRAWARAGSSHGHDLAAVCRKSRAPGGDWRTPHWSRLQLQLLLRLQLQHRLQALQRIAIRKYFSYENAAHAWPAIRNVPFRFVPLLAMDGVDYTPLHSTVCLWLIYAFPLAMPYLVALSTVIAVLRQKV